MRFSDPGVAARHAGGAGVVESRHSKGEKRRGSDLRKWSSRLREAVADGRTPVHLVGVGNELRGDDAAGLEIVSKLRSRLGTSPARGVKIHARSPMPERLLAKLASDDGRIVIFDAVEASKQPGEVVFCRLSDTKYGFFATHNIPLRLVPGLAQRKSDTFLVGVQPASLEVGGGLSETMRESVQRVVEVVTEGVEGRA
jgi:hydrogenase maturation protease